MSAKPFDRTRLATVAIGGAVLGWLTYEAIYMFNPLRTQRATTSWLLSFCLGVLRQHYLHGKYTFAGVSPMKHGLARAYAFYGTVALLGAGINEALTVGVGISHRAAWLVCLCVTTTCSWTLLAPLVYGVRGEARP